MGLSFAQGEGSDVGGCPPGKHQVVVGADEVGQGNKVEVGEDGDGGVGAELVRGCGARVGEGALECGDVAAEEGTGNNLLGSLGERSRKVRELGLGYLWGCGTVAEALWLGVMSGCKEASKIVEVKIVFGGGSIDRVARLAGACREGSSIVGILVGGSRGKGFGCEVCKEIVGSGTLVGQWRTRVVG